MESAQWCFRPIILLWHWYSTWIPVCVPCAPLPIQLLGSLDPHGRPGRSLWLLALDWLSYGELCGHLESEAKMEDQSLYYLFSITHSVFRTNINNFCFFKCSGEMVSKITEVILQIEKNELLIKIIGHRFQIKIISSNDQNKNIIELQTSAQLTWFSDQNVMIFR